MQNNNYLGGVISLLLGLTIGFTLLVFIYTLVSYFTQGILEAFFFAFLYMIPGLFIIVLLEFILLSFAKFEENKRQTKLLEEILAELKATANIKVNELPIDQNIDQLDQ